MMNLINKKQTLYGLDEYDKVIDTVVSDLKAEKYYFDIKLILTEALTNAFEHGNDGDKNKPIDLVYNFDGKYLNFKVISSNTKPESISIPKSIDEDSLLDEHGRGLFLIQSMADKVEFKDNSLIITKCIL
ncbi:serine-protein kinase RsbW [Clostridium oryzae]|uniref:Serine-protein kinase RsbW n=2 Tax=Clostridium oryzae TaxID=1450648 RepID=A0A1V4ILM2_9CLOT|nr:serine-protein kinase RsbW [Clostridium oryzae]